ncbi:MAG: hypothetical protein JXA28_05735 [Bacteroidetes bacterium]|nr:hypothetical protein [Bacteroidota bacterium]
MKPDRGLPKSARNNTGYIVCAQAAFAAWFRIACLACNIMHAVRTAWPDEAVRKAKRLRFVIINVTGRFSRDRRKITLHLSATKEWIQHLMTLFDSFPLRTQPTG